MIEPVAYIQIKDGKAYSVLRKGTPNDEYTPVYTAEQLHPRVKMTRAEFDEFNKFFKYRKDTTIFNMIAFIQYNENNETENLYNRFYETGTLEGSIEAQAEFSWLWATYNPDSPQESIDIIPNMKWFVRSKETNRTEYNDFLLIDSERIHGWYPFVDKKIATQFDTKEEAELWTNPLTEAVQLPVEENK